MGWVDGPLLAFDTESTGTDPLQARIVTAATVLVGEANAGPRAIDARDWLVNPGVPIPAAASEIHGVTDDIAATGRPTAEALVEIAGILEGAWSRGLPVIAYNATYDLTLVASELARNDMPPLHVGHVIDPLVIDRAVDKYRKGKRTLEVTCQHYRVVLDEAHQAGSDATAAARLAWRLAQTYPALVGELSLAELHEAQVLWQQQWADHYQEYLRTKGGKPDAVIDGSWPVRQPNESERAVA